MKMINFEKFVIIEVLFIQSLSKIYGKKQIVFWAEKFGIRSLFLSIEFEIDQIVHDRLNISVTYSSLQQSQLLCLTLANCATLVYSFQVRQLPNGVKHVRPFVLAPNLGGHPDLTANIRPWMRRFQNTPAYYTKV
jgi:hypothetical protein